MNSNLLDGLNSRQQEAVLHFDGPLLILAGAGSGKTRVLTHRIAYLIEEHGINPYQILALTFTNKAANEMRERVDDIVTFGAQNIWVSTFHSTCVRILRRYISRLEYQSNFTIYDTDDQRALMKDICKHLNIDTKKLREKMFLNAISSAKDELLTPEQYADTLDNNVPNKKKIIEVYREYQKRMKHNNALDFDDLIMLTVQLFREDAEVLDYYQNRFRYILVDEYQDTNTAQFALLSLLASRYQNLCVVGDDDQSIYKFRGANIYNILNFEKIFPATKVIRLEQNYRSTQNILTAANEVIKNNSMRKEKALWTEAGEGAPVSYGRYDNEYEEAKGIVSDISHAHREGHAYSDFAVLYRTNAQSRVLEEAFVYQGIPYRVVGAINFYARKEIKDLLCYLKTINNSADDIAIKRIINIPKRGIGATTIGRITSYSLEHEISFYDALTHIDDIPGCSRASANITSFLSLIEMFRNKLRDDTYSLENLLQDVIDATGYVRELEQEDTPEAEARIENIDSLYNKIVQYEDDCPEIATLDGLLEDIALVSDMDTVSEDADQVLLMTVHNAKGLEFPQVYMCGMEENMFPGAIAVFGDDPTEMEEERRLCYVGITRAREKLTLTSANQRMKNGELNFFRPSRFIHEIPRHLIKQTYGAVPREINSNPSQLSSPTDHGSYSPSMASRYSKDKENPFAENPYISKGLSHPRQEPDYGVGSRVRHTKFGTGTVTSLTKLDNDYEVVVDFDTFGQRKLRSSFAKLIQEVNE